MPGILSIAVPEYLSKKEDSTSSLLLRYENEKKQLFLLIYEEQDASGQSLEVIFKLFSDNLISKIEHGNLMKYYPEKINNQDAFIGNIRGKTNEMGLYYRIAVIEANKKYYEVIFGTSDDDQLFVDDDISKCIQSIKFLIQ